MHFFFPVQCQVCRDEGCASSVGRDEGCERLVSVSVIRLCVCDEGYEHLLRVRLASEEEGVRGMGEGVRARRSNGGWRWLWRLRRVQAGNGVGLVHLVRLVQCESTAGDDIVKFESRARDDGKCCPAAMSETRHCASDDVNTPETASAGGGVEGRGALSRRAATRGMHHVEACSMPIEAHCRRTHNVGQARRRPRRASLYTR